MKAEPAFLTGADSYPRTTEAHALDRRAFLRQSLAFAGGCAACLPMATAAQERELSKPISVAQDILPGRVIWVHDSELTDWWHHGGINE